MIGRPHKSPRKAALKKDAQTHSFDILFAAVVLFLLAGLVMLLKL